jgi:hypothetical protein
MDHVSIETIISVVKAHGSDAIFEDGCLRVYPRDQGSPRVFVVPPWGFGRKIIISIAKRCGIQSHLFWHPSQVGLAPVGQVNGPPESQASAESETPRAPD